MIAILLVMATLTFMASVTTELQDAAVAVAGIITLIVIVDAFKALSK